MIIISNTTDFEIPYDTAVIIGKFDGYHRGHQKLIENAMKKTPELKVAVFTFSPSPAAFFSKAVVQELSTVEEKRSLFESAGVDYLIEYPFCQEIADMDPEEYIRRVLVSQMHAKCIVAGEDVSFGKKGLGDYRLLQEKATIYDYDVILVDKVLYHDREVSSTYVREAVREGDMETASALLGNDYCVTGKIVHGRKLGRTIGMPTVNLTPSKEKLLPPNGVYYSYTIFNGKKYQSITNIGTKPTVNEEKVMGVETYIYDFSGDIYGEQIEVALLKWKRPEMKFADVDALKAQMQEDLHSGMDFFGMLT